MEQAFKIKDIIKLALRAQAGGDFLTANVAACVVATRVAGLTAGGEMENNRVIYVRDKFSPGLSLLVFKSRGNWIATPLSVFAPEIVAEIMRHSDGEIVCRAKWNSGEFHEENPREEVEPLHDGWEELEKLVPRKFIDNAIMVTADAETRILSRQKKGGYGYV